MAKKKNYPPVVQFAAYEPPPRPDNNPSSGLVKKPNYALNGCPYPEGKMFMPGFVDDGGSPNRGDVNVITADGVASSKGRDKGRQYNYGFSTDGAWNDNDFEGGNMTGM